MKSKLMNLKRSYIVKAYKYAKELRDTMWERRIESASVYTARPVCDQCGGEVVKLRHKIRMGKNFFKVTCLACTFSWFTKKVKAKPDISEEMQSYADRKGLSVENCLHILQLREKALDRIDKRRTRINNRAEQDAAAIRAYSVANRQVKVLMRAGREKDGL